jgi:drug/metabolite transporter (DMT)-like permease
MSVVFIVLFGIYFLGERTHMRKKLLAAAIACVGLTLILYGKLIV